MLGNKQRTAMKRLKVDKSEVITLLVHLAVWGIIILVPSVLQYTVSYDLDTAVRTGQGLFGTTKYVALYYFLNFYILIPFLLFRKRYLFFFAINACIIAVPCIIVATFDFVGAAKEVGAPEMPQHVLSVGVVFLAVFMVLVMSCAIVIRSFLLWSRMRRELQEQKQKATEAELAMLKNQLSPHFLFNTLNNISSLMFIDAHAASESIGQLSDLLRYMLYETKSDRVSLQGEVDFMKNYIHLMGLRCSELTTIETDFDIPEQQSLQVAPLLFISIVENAFKHGVSNREASFIRIHLRADAGRLHFVCRNSNFPKGSGYRDESGIGLENLRRRLELLYPGRFSYRHELQGNVYHVEMKIEL